MKRYVVESIAGPDLSSIEDFYSALGAGHGSAFWVAELIEPQPAMPTAPSDAAPQLTPRPSRSASAAGTRLQAGDKAADAPVAETLSEEGPVTRTNGSSAGRAQPPEMAPEQSDEPGDEDGDAATATVGSQPDSSIDSSSAAGASSADAEEREVRSLVAGLVAAAVSRIERASSSTATPATLGLTCEDATLEPEGPEADSKDGPELGAAKAQVAAAEASPAMPAPGTPVKRPCIGSFAEPAPASAPLPVPGPAGAAAAAVAVVASQSLRSGGAAGGGGDRRPIIIGHVALERKSWRLAELRRMSVLKQYAGQGVGGRLLETLVAHARDVGFRELVLYTSGMQPAARRLYERGGWSVGKVSRVQGMDVYMYTLDLTRRA